MGQMIALDLVKKNRMAITIDIYLKTQAFDEFRK